VQDSLSLGLCSPYIDFFSTSLSTSLLFFLSAFSAHCHRLRTLSFSSLLHSLCSLSLFCTWVIDYLHGFLPGCRSACVLLFLLGLWKEFLGFSLHSLHRSGTLGYSLHIDFPSFSCTWGLSPFLSLSGNGFSTGREGGTHSHWREGLSGVCSWISAPAIDYRFLRL